MTLAIHQYNHHYKTRHHRGNDDCFHTEPDGSAGHTRRSAPGLPHSPVWADPCRRALGGLTGQPGVGPWRRPNCLQDDAHFNTHTM